MLTTTADRTDHSCLGIHDPDDLAVLDGLKDELATNFGLDVIPLQRNAQDPPSPSSCVDLEVFRCSA